MAEEAYFQFPLCALAHGGTIHERLHAIISYCVMAVGEGRREKMEEDAIEEEIAQVQGNGELPPDFTGAESRHIAAALGAHTTQVKMGSVKAILKEATALAYSIRGFEQKHGRSPLVRIKTQFLWEVLNNAGMTYRELKTLCAVYSCIGASEKPVRITKKTIRHRMLGYKSQAIMEAEISAREDKEKPLTERQVLTTLDSLHSRGFFARMRANARQTYYSHRLAHDEFKKALFEMKTWRAFQRANRIEEDKKIMEAIRITNTKAQNTGN